MKKPKTPRTKKPLQITYPGFLDEVKDVFFLAMLNGYAQYKRMLRTHDIHGLAGSKAIYFFHGDFYVVDMWFTSPNSNKSAGSTMIFYKDHLVWVMYYGGWYKKDAIPFLKRCLLCAYRNDEFYGGRGPNHVKHRGLVYENKRNLESFSNFEGIEFIQNEKTGNFLGTHWYHGMSLVD